MRRMNFLEKLLALLLLVANSAQAIEPALDSAAEPAVASAVKSVCMSAYRAEINHWSCLLANYDHRFMSEAQADGCEGRQGLKIFGGSIASGAVLMMTATGPLGVGVGTAAFLVGSGGFFAYRGIRREVLKRAIHGLEATYFMIEEAITDGDGIYLRRAYRDLIGERLDMTELKYEDFVEKIKTLDASGVLCQGDDVLKKNTLVRKIRKGKL